MTRKNPSDFNAKFVVSHLGLDYLRHIGQGGESVISSVVNPYSNEPIVLKTMIETGVDTGDELEIKQNQYFLEYQLQKEVYSRGGKVPEQIDVGFAKSENNKQVYLLMEQIGHEPVTLSDILSLNEISLDCTIDYCYNIAKTLKIIDSLKYIHGDVKPSNILLDEKGNSVLADFDQARLSSIIDSGLKRGTIQYMENSYIKTGDPSFLDKSALGMILFQGITNQLLIEGIKGNQYFAIYQQYLGIENKVWEEKLKIKNSTKLLDESKLFIDKVLIPKVDDRYQSFDEICKRLGEIRVLCKSDKEINLEKESLVSKVIELRKVQTGKNIIGLYDNAE